MDIKKIENDKEVVITEDDAYEILEDYIYNNEEVTETVTALALESDVSFDEALEITQCNIEAELEKVISDGGEITIGDVIIVVE